MERIVHKSQFVPKANWGNRLSPLTHLGFGSNGFDPHEATHSSHWLWTAQSSEDLKPRFVLGYPEEYLSFLASKSSENILQHIQLDLFVFRDLDPFEFELLGKVLKENIRWKTIFIRNQLNDYKRFFANEYISAALSRRQAYLSFLPPASTHDSLLSPQEVLWDLQKVETSIPILILDVPTSQNSFFNTLDKKVYAEEVKSKQKNLISLFKTFDALGLGNLVLFFEAFLGFFLGYKIQSFLTAIFHLFNLKPWIELGKRTTNQVWHKFLKPLFSAILFSILWPTINFVFYKTIYASLTFVWYRALKMPADKFYNILVKNIAIFTWHKILIPICSFVQYRFFGFIWFKVIGFFRYKAYGFLRYFFGTILVPFGIFVWHKIIKPICTFFEYSVLGFFKYKIFGCLRWVYGKSFVPSSIFIWHRILKPIISFFEYSVCGFFRYKIFGFMQWTYGMVLRRGALLLWYKVLRPLFAAFFDGPKYFYGHALIPFFNFIFYKVLQAYPQWLWIYFRHKTLQPIYSFIRYTVLVKIWVLVRYKTIHYLMYLLLPFRKVYWILQHEYEKRIKYRGSYE